MANNTSAVAITKPGANGGCFWAPVGTAVPTSISDSINAKFKNAGYISSDGYEKAENSDEGDSIYAWGGDTVITADGKKSPTVKFSILQTSDPDALALAYSENNITGVLNAGSVIYNNENPSAKALIFKTLRRDGVVQIEVFPNCQFSTRGDTKNDNETPDQIEVTYKLLPDNKGNYGYRYYGTPA